MYSTTNEDRDLGPYSYRKSAKSKWPHLLIEICPQQRTTFCHAQWFTPVFPQETQAARLRPVWTPQWTTSEKLSPLSFPKIILQGHISNYNTKSSLRFHGCHFLRVHLMSRGERELSAPPNTSSPRSEMSQSGDLAKPSARCKLQMERREALGDQEPCPRQAIIQAREQAGGEEAMHMWLQQVASELLAKLPTTSCLQTSSGLQ